MESDQKLRAGNLINLENLPIDFVILWVDGNDPKHVEKRREWLNTFTLADGGNAEQSTDAQRFEDHGELAFCIHSIIKHAPWYRRIYVVSDEQTPAWLSDAEMNSHRIQVVDHKVIFQGKEHCLPTFNSRAIAARVHHLPKLSEHFVLGCDDCMFSHPVLPSDFFEKGNAKLFADWVQYDAGKHASLHFRGILNSTQSFGGWENGFAQSSHCFIPMQRSVMGEMEKRYPYIFETNLKHRFRHESQVVIESLYHHYCHLELGMPLASTEKMVNFSTQLCREGDPSKIAYLFELLTTGERTMFCVNDFGSLVTRYPDLTAHLRRLCYLKGNGDAQKRQKSVQEVCVSNAVTA